MRAAFVRSMDVALRRGRALRMLHCVPRGIHS
jgi:hypothetical protein